MYISPRNNFDLLQNFIPYRIVKYKDNKYYIMINISVSEADIFGYNLYFFIDDKFAPDYRGNEIYDFLSNIDLENDNIRDILINGTESLIAGKDYFLSGETDDEYIMSSNINDYLCISGIKIKDIDNISYFIYKNKAIENNQFNDDELDKLNSTFMKIIQTYSDMYGNAIDSLDFVYQNVIDYYANGQYDDAIILMNSIFNTQLTTSVTANCGCNSQSDCTSVSSGTSTINTGTDLVSLDTATCADKYKAAMYQWLIQMLSDINFYCNWMFTTVENEDNITIPDEELIDNLIELLTEFLNANYDLSNLKGCKSACNCGHSKKYFSNKTTGDCADIMNNGIGVNVDNCSYYTIIENYIKALNWIKNNQIDENKNKIYVYGKQFAEIFPLLSF